MPKFYVLLEIEGETAEQVQEAVIEAAEKAEGVTPLGMAVDLPSLVDFVNHLATGHGGN